MKIRYLLQYILFSQLFLLSPSAFAQTQLKFSTIENSAVAAIAADILLEAYSKLGFEIEIYPTSGKRSLVLSSKGSYDGEVVRIYAVGETFPELKRVELTGFLSSTVVYVIKEGLDSLSIDTLDTKRVGHLEGVVHAERFTKDFRSVWKAQTIDELFELLVAGRLDAVVSMSVAGELITGNLALADVVQLSPPIETEQFYHYLHKKNEHLIPKIQAVLEEMYATGETDAIKRATMKRLAHGLEVKSSNLSGNCSNPC